MSVLEIIKELQKEGHSVGYRKRSDGGYIITKIDGITYTGATGNNTARNMLGISMSDAQMTQRRSNVERYIKIPRSKSGKKKGHKAKGDELTEGEKAKIKELQELARKSKKKTGIDRGTISRKTARRYKKLFGEKALDDLLNERIRYYQGYANEKNVRYVIAKIERLIVYFSDKKKILTYLEDSKKYLERNILLVKDEYIEPISDKIYDVKKLKTIESARDLNDYIHSVVI